jgi:hypothetical protein
MNELGEPSFLDQEEAGRRNPRPPLKGFVAAGAPSPAAPAQAAPGKAPDAAAAPAPAEPKRRKGDQAPSGGASGRRGDKERRHLARIDAMKLSKEQSALLKVLVKASLMAQQSVRDLTGALYDTYVLAVDSEETKAMKLQGVAYSQTVRAAGKGHRHGPPACHFFSGLIESLLTRGVALGSQTFQTMFALQKVLEDQTVEEVFMAVRHCKLNKMYDKTKLRLSLVLFQAPINAWVAEKVAAVQADKENDDLQQLLPGLLKLQGCCVRTLLRRALAEAGAQHLTGRAPPGAVEELLQSALEVRK